MRGIALAAIAAVTSMVVTPLAVSAEPMVLTAVQMASITAAAAPRSINVNVQLGDVLVQTNRTIQVAGRRARHWCDASRARAREHLQGCAVRSLGCD